MGHVVAAAGSGVGGLLALVSATSLAVPEGCSPPVATEDLPAETTSVAREAATPTWQGVYVVSANGSDGFCDTVGFPGNHGAAIQSCIDRANADGGGIVLVRSGTYSSGTWPIALKAGVTLTGQAAGATFSPSGTAVIGSVGDNTVVSGLRFDISPLSAGGAAIVLQNGTHRNVRIEDNSFSSGASTTGNFYGVYSPPGANGFERITIRDNEYRQSLVAHFGAMHHPVYLQITSGTGTMRYISIDNNHFSLTAASSAPHITLNTQNSVSHDPVTISNNTMTCGPGVVCSSPGIRLTGVMAMVAGNQIRSISPVTAAAGGSGSSCGVQVLGNDFSGGWVNLSTCGYGRVFGNTDDRTSQGLAGNLMGTRPVVTRASRSSNQSFTAGTATTVVFTTEEVDLSGSLNPGTGTFTAPGPGLSRVNACARFTAGNFVAGNTAEVQIVAGGTIQALNRVVYSGGSANFTSCVNDIVQLSKNTALQMVVDATGSGSRTVYGSGRHATFLSIEKISD